MRRSVCQNQCNARHEHTRAHSLIRILVAQVGFATCEVRVEPGTRDATNFLLQMPECSDYTIILQQVLRRRFGRLRPQCNFGLRLLEGPPGFLT